MLDGDGFNYLGTIDDVAVRHPWRFKLDETRLTHSLLTQLLDGRPVLLNEGYLVHHPIARQALLDRDSLLWELIDAGFVQVLTRAGAERRLDEVPPALARTIDSFSHLVNDEIPGVRWAALRDSLRDADHSLRERGLLRDWPGYESGSGFLAFAQDLRAAGARPRSLGMGNAVTAPALDDFLDRFIAEMQRDPVAPRDRWERVARRRARLSPHVADGPAFLNAMMNFATEMYHYNMGVMLSAHYRVPVSVETQASAAFDDLLVRPQVLVDELPAYPRLRAPRVLATVDPKRLVSIIRPGSPSALARAEWVARRRAWEQRATQGLPADPAALADLREAGRAYTAALGRLLGQRVRYEGVEEIFTTVVDEGAQGVGGWLLAAGAGSAAAAAAASFGIPTAGIAAAGAVAGGYVVGKLAQRAGGAVTRKFSVRLLEQQIMPPEWVQRSQAALNRIKWRRTASSIDIDGRLATAMAARMTPYAPR